MDINLEKYLHIYIEESLEMLQLMENALLELEIGTFDLEKINQIFRTAHSLKGNSAAFVFNTISELSHTVESFLEPIRSEKVTITQNHIDLLLKTVDCFRKIINHIQNNNTDEDICAIDLADMFTKLSTKKSDDENKTKTQTKTESITKNTNTDVKKTKQWKIIFNPGQDLFQLGHDPIEIFNMLAKIGKLEVNADATRMPPFSQLDPTQCYLSWEINLHSDISLHDLQELFYWVSNKDNLIITPLETQQPPSMQTQEAENLFISPENANIIKPKQGLKADEAIISDTTITSVRVATEKINKLIDQVGELVITQSILSQLNKDFFIERLSPKLFDVITALERNSRDLQQSVMNLRMLPIAFILNRLKRVIHDVANQANKKIELSITGENTEIDRFILEKIADPLLHLIRNAIDHGIEEPAIRTAAGKPATGKIQIDIYQSAGNILIDIKDDGAGLNINTIRAKAIEHNIINEHETLTEEDIYNLLFKPGFSTATKITDISGRGVGLDVVYKVMRELSASIDVHSEAGHSTTFRLRLPLTLIIIDCQLIQVRGQDFIVPITNIVEILKIDRTILTKVANYNYIYYFRDKYVPIISLSKTFSIENPLNYASHVMNPNDESSVDSNISPHEELHGLVPAAGSSANEEINAYLPEHYLIIVEVNNKLYAIAVDKILSQQRIVIKSLEENYQRVPGISSAAILGDGKIGLIIDVNDIVDISIQRNKYKQMHPTTNISEEESHNIDEMIVSDVGKPFQFLTFQVSNKEFGLNIEDILEIRNWDNATPIPNAPHYIKGLINFRGSIIPVIDLHERFYLEQIDSYGPRTVVIMLSIKRNKHKQIIGVIADAVSDTHTVTYKDISPIPEMSRSTLSDYIGGIILVNNKKITLLSTQKIMTYRSS